MGALRSMTSFLGYSEPEEETYEDLSLIHI